MERSHPLDFLLHLTDAPNFAREARRRSWEKTDEELPQVPQVGVGLAQGASECRHMTSWLWPVTQMRLSRPANPPRERPRGTGLVPASGQVE